MIVNNECVAGCVRVESGYAAGAVVEPAVGECAQIDRSHPALWVVEVLAWLRWVVASVEQQPAGRVHGRHRVHLSARGQTPALLASGGSEAVPTPHNIHVNVPSII